MDADFLLSLRTGIPIEELMDIYMRKGEIINISQIPEEYTEYIRRLISGMGLRIVTENNLDSNLRFWLEQLKGLFKTPETNGPLYIGDGQQIFIDIQTSLANSEENVLVNDDNNVLVNNDNSVLVNNNVSYITMPIMADYPHTKGTVDDELVNSLILMNEIQQSQIDALRSQVESLSMQQSSGGSSSGSSGLSLQQQIDAAVQEAIQGLNIGNSNLENRLSVIEMDINQIRNTFDNNNTVYEENLDYGLRQKIDSISTFSDRIDDIDNNYLRKGTMKDGQWIKCQSASYNVVNGSDMIISAVVCTSEEDLEAEQNIKTEQIIAVYNGTLYEYDSDDDRYFSYNLMTDRYEGQFVYDTKAEAIVYVIYNKHFVKVANQGFTLKRTNMDIRTIQLEAGDSIEIERMNNFDKIPATVLIEDTVSGSRTEGEYINSEGIITVVNKTNSFVLYNDSEDDANLKVFIPNMASNNSSGDDEPVDINQLKTELRDYIDGRILNNSNRIAVNENSIENINNSIIELRNTVTELQDRYEEGGNEG